MQRRWAKYRWGLIKLQAAARGMAQRRQAREMCHDRVTNEVVPLITKFSKHDAFLFGLSTTPGKRLINLLLLSALYHNSPESVVSDIANSFTLRQNWLGFVASNKRGPSFNRYHTESWSAFIISSGLDKPTMGSQEAALLLI